MKGPWFDGYDWLNAREPVELEERDVSLDGVRWATFKEFEDGYGAYLDRLEARALELFRAKLAKNGEVMADVIKDTTESTICIEYLGGKFVRAIQFKAVTRKYCYVYGAFYASTFSGYARSTHIPEKIQRFSDISDSLCCYRAGFACIQTLRGVVEESMAVHGDTWDAILVSTELDDFFLSEHTGLEHRPFIIWTQNRIYFEHTHRQAWDGPSITQVRSLPRLPLYR